MQVYKLGKQAPKKDSRTLMLAKYLTAGLPALPTNSDWSQSVSEWGMMMNDSVGDCTCASAGHLIMGWTADQGNEVVPTDEQIIAAYSAITGYNPSDPSTDNGANELDVLNYWRATGIAGHNIGAFMSIDSSNLDHIKYAVYLFGGAYIGVALPAGVQGADSWGDPPSQDGDWAPGSWGGHAVPIVAFDDDAQEFTVITWGKPLKMSYGFFAAYCEEAYAVLSPDFVNGNQPAPNGFDLPTLQSDLNDLN